MTDEQLKIATYLKGKIDKLDDEIYLIMNITPSIRSGSKCTGARGIIRKIRSSKLLIPQRPYGDVELELSNEDCRTLIDIRTAEVEALKQVLANIN